MKVLAISFVLWGSVTLAAFAQATLEQEWNQRATPEYQLESDNAQERVLALHQELDAANKEAEFWRNAAFHDDPKRERYRKEQLVYWSQRTVEIRNELTRIKQNRSRYQHKSHGSDTYYYKK